MLVAGVGNTCQVQWDVVKQWRPRNEILVLSWVFQLLPTVVVPLLLRGSSHNFIVSNLTYRKQSERALWFISCIRTYCLHTCGVICGSMIQLTLKRSETIDSWTFFLVVHFPIHWVSPFMYVRGFVVFQSLILVLVHIIEKKHHWYLIFKSRHWLKSILSL